MGMSWDGEYTSAAGGEGGEGGEWKQKAYL